MLRRKPTGKNTGNSEAALHHVDAKPSKKSAGHMLLLPEMVRIPFRTGETVLEALLRAKAPVVGSCGGMGTCTTCRIVINNVSSEPPLSLPPRTDLEEEHASDRGFSEVERLACQLPAQESLQFELPERSPED